MTRQTTLAHPTLDLEERRRLIEAEPLPRNIHDLISRAASESGDKVLWHFFENGTRITYAEMYARVIGLAAGLQSIGIRKGTHVAVMLPNVEAFPLTWLAIGVLGAVMVPVNVGYQRRELVYVLNDSDAEYLVVDASRMDAVSAGIEAGEIRLNRTKIVVAGGPTPHECTDWSALAVCTERPELPQVSLDDLLNIQYTSGTTGFPKGCMLTQRYWIVSGKVNAMRDGRKFERILASTPFYYMDPQWLLLMTVYQRATLFVAAKQSASRFTSWLREFGIEFCLFPYVVFKQPTKSDDRVPTVVRGNVYGVPKGIHAALEERFDFCAREAFGMTEVGSAMFMPIEASDMVGSGSCGKPSPFRECRIVDEQGVEVQTGEIGELVIRGPGILVGYYKNAEATRQALRDGWFHTGDLFRRDERGYFYIVGRVKDMIRRSSENIAAREVESVLNSAPSVLESAAIGVPDEVRGEEVKAYLVLKEGVQPTQDVLHEVIAVCTAQLARFKVPRYYSFRASLPKTPSLKIAKQVLKSEALQPQERTFDRIRQVWMESPAMQDEV
jgi:acyl-CoA synthetase (AMP-forming)/AMP-acid ligase II